MSGKPRNASLPLHSALKYTRRLAYSQNGYCGLGQDRRCQGSCSRANSPHRHRCTLKARLNCPQEQGRDSKPGSTALRPKLSRSAQVSSRLACSPHHSFLNRSADQSADLHAGSLWFGYPLVRSQHRWVVPHLFTYSTLSARIGKIQHARRLHGEADGCH